MIKVEFIEDPHDCPKCGCMEPFTSVNLICCEAASSEELDACIKVGE